MGAVKVGYMTQLLCIYPQADNPGSVYHDPGGHGGVHVHLKPQSFMGGIHHCWHPGVSFMSDLFNCKTHPLALGVASSLRCSACPLGCLLTGLRRCGNGA